jgi:hypothetical protein
VEPAKEDLLVPTFGLVAGEYESQFKQIENEATDLARKCDVNTDYRQQKRKRFHDEIAEDEGIFGARKKFMIETYLVSLDSIINSIGKRREHLENVVSKFRVLEPTHFDNADNVKKLKILAGTYSEVIDSQAEIAQEFLSFKDMYKKIMSTRSKANSSVEKLPSTMYLNS